MHENEWQLLIWGYRKTSQRETRVFGSWMHIVIKAIDNNKERKRNHSTETQNFNVKNPLQQRKVKTTGSSQQTFHYFWWVYLQTPWVIL
jgi:hypothetical protein